MFENNACVALELQDDISKNNGNIHFESMTYKERCDHCQNKSKKCDANYRDLHFILGSASVLERLWSMDDSILNNSVTEHQFSLWRRYYIYVKINNFGTTN